MNLQDLSSTRVESQCKMDPNRNTRDEFTSALVVLPIPDFASAEWRSYVQKSQVLLDKLAHHPAMAPNLQQTYMTPAKSKNKVYFQWDFVGRTLVRILQDSEI